MNNNNHNNDSNSNIECKCTAIGASAGGLNALEEFFMHLPLRTEMAFVVIQHLSPDKPSMMEKLLSKTTALPVETIKENLKIRPNHIYVLPPGYYVTIKDCILHLTKIPADDHYHRPINLFLKSLAEDLKENAISVIFSGTGSDGTEGIRKIKEYGGKVFVQQPESSQFSDMPENAIKTGLVDHVDTPADIAMNLMKLSAQVSDTDSDELVILSEEEEKIFRLIIELIRFRTEKNFFNYKENTIIRRLKKRMEELKIPSLKEYFDYLEMDNNEVQIISRQMFISVTGFFRDPEAFEVLKNKVIPEIFNNSESGNDIRIWTVGCSTGEEAYSIAILFREYMQEHRINRHIKIFATDIDQEILSVANKGLFEEEKLSEIKPDLKERYFVPRFNKYQIIDQVRKMIVFSLHDIMQDPPFLNIDLLSCRNLLIYFKTFPQKKILASLNFSLKNKGFLFLGKSESLADNIESYQTINSHWKIFQNKSKDDRKFIRELFMSPPPRHSAYRHTTLNSGESTNVYSLTDSHKKTFNEKMLDFYMPPGVLVDANYKISEIFQQVNPYIRFKPGKLSFNLIKLAHPELSGVLASLVKKVFTEKRLVNYDNILFEEEGQNHIISIEGRYLELEENSQVFAVITFHKKESYKAIDIDKAIETSDSELKDKLIQYNDIIKSLKNRLNLTEETLQNTVDNLEITNEELQTTNEELISSNEELQSTNEELQSLNEELYTVNNEHQRKINELSDLNTDINNLLNNANDLGIILLDKDLHIKRFTPFTSRLINIKKSDLKRSFMDLSLNIDYPDMMQDLLKCLDEGNVINTEKQDEKGTWYSIRINPFKQEQNEIEGVVIIIVDISANKKVETQKEEAIKVLSSVLDVTEGPRLIINEKGVINYASEEFQQMLDIKLKDLAGRHYTDFLSNCHGEHGAINDENKDLFDILKGLQHSGEPYPITCQLATDDRKHLQIHAIPATNRSGNINGVIFKVVE
jgi:two-component system CheB/CheR fusion protein